MKTCLAILALGTAFAAVADEYIVDIVYPRSNTTLSLTIDESGRAHKDYDAYILYPTAFIVDEIIRPAEWEKRGLGTFADISITHTGAHMVASLTLDDAELDWTDYRSRDMTTRVPAFRVMHITSTNLHMFLERWISFGGHREDGEEVEGMQIRIRKKVPQPET